MCLLSYQKLTALKPYQHFGNSGKKSDNKIKARLVSARNVDREKYTKNDKRSPTPCMLVVKWVIAHAVRIGWSMYHADIDSAFLNGRIDRTKYIQIPWGFRNENNKTHVAKLNKAIYGLAIAANCWFSTISVTIRKTY